MSRNNNTENIGGLLHWIKESTKSHNYKGLTVEQRVQRLIDKQEPLTMERILYRVHSPNSPTIVPRSWFSTSSTLNKVVQQHRTKNATCCLFRIHIMPGIRILDINDFFIRKHISLIKPNDDDESEIIVDKGGVFSNPRSKNTFHYIGMVKGLTTFETYYYPAPVVVKAPSAPVGVKAPSKSYTPNSNTIFGRLKNEIDFIDSREDLDSWPGLFLKNEKQNSSVLNNVWKRIQNTKRNIGGRRTRKKRH
jgi:hypothetical protein